MARVQKFKIESRAGLFSVKHKCALGLWKDSKKLFLPAPNRFISEQCARDSIKRFADNKNIDYEIVE